mgnify:CR=1 FL=1
MRYRLQRHDGTDCSATMVPITVLRMVPIQRYRHLNGVPSCFTSIKRPVSLSRFTHCSVLGLKPENVFSLHHCDVRLLTVDLLPYLTFHFILELYSQGHAIIIYRRMLDLNIGLFVKHI